MIITYWIMMTNTTNTNKTNTNKTNTNRMSYINKTMISSFHFLQ